VTSVALVIAALLLTGVAQPASADTLNWAPGSAIVAPANAGTVPDVTILAISCTQTTEDDPSCAAVGSYIDNSGSRQALMTTETGGVLGQTPSGTWSPPIELTLPPTAPTASDPQASLTGVSCSRPYHCTATGTYTDSSDHLEGMRTGEYSPNGGQPIWHAAVEVIHPAGVHVAANALITIAGVSCATGTSCALVGSYMDNTNHTQGFEETEAPNGAGVGVWSTDRSPSYDGTAIVLPSDAATEPNVTLTGVSCGAAGVCAAVGSYENTLGQTEGLTLDETSGVFQAGHSVTPPPDAAIDPLLRLTSVDCTTAGNCDAVGVYRTTAGTTNGLAVTETNGVWGTATALPLPADASSTSPSVEIASVSCTGLSVCGAVGDYDDADDNQQGLLITAPGSWTAATAAPPPTVPDDAGATVIVTLSSVSCWSAGACAAAGTYFDDSFSAHPFVLSEATDGTAAGIEPGLPYSAATPFANTALVGCAPGGDCVATSDYIDQAGHPLASAINGTADAPAPSALSLTAPPDVVQLGDSIAASDLNASLQGTTASADGAVTFSVFGPQNTPPVNCAYGATALGAQPVAGVTAVPSPESFTPSATGDYWWYAAYTGDLSNAPAMSTCGSAMPETVVQAVPPTTTTPTVTTPTTTSTTTATTTTTTPTTTTPGTPPPKRPSVIAAPHLISINVVGPDRVVVRLSCHASSGDRCSGRVVVTVKERFSAGKLVGVTASRQRTVVLTAAHRSVSIRNGGKRKVTLTIGLRARALLAKRGVLPAHLVITTHRRSVSRTISFHRRQN
jgi:hypothetical protein